MIKQAVLYKLATLRLAINYVLRSRMVKQADGLQGRMFNPANRRRGTYTAGSYQTPSSPEPMSIPVGTSKNTTIQDNMNPQNNPWAWDNPSNPQAQPVAMGASKPIPRQPKPVAPKPQYTPSNMNFRNGQYYGRGNIATWGDQIAKERARLDHNFNLAPNKARWQQAYDERTKALDELENKWNQFNNLRQSNRLTYDKANNKYTGDYNNIENERNLLNMARDMYSPEQLKKNNGSYDQRMEALNTYKTWFNPHIDFAGFWGSSPDVQTTDVNPKDSYNYFFTQDNVPEWENQIKAEQDRLQRLYADIPEEAKPRFYDDLLARKAGLSALQQRLNAHNKTYAGFKFEPNTSIAWNKGTEEAWNNLWDSMYGKEMHRITSLQSLVSPKMRNQSFLEDEDRLFPAIEDYNKDYYNWYRQFDGSHNSSDWLYAHAMDFRHANNYDKALEIIDRAIGQDPYNENYQMERKLILYEIEEKERERNEELKRKRDAILNRHGDI